MLRGVKSLPFKPASWAACIPTKAGSVHVYIYIHTHVVIGDVDRP